MIDLVQCRYCGAWRHKRVAKCLTCGKAKTVPYLLVYCAGLVLCLLIAGLLTGCAMSGAPQGDYPHRHITVNGEVITGLNYD